MGQYSTCHGLVLADPRCTVPTHAQSWYSAHLFCHCIVIGRRTNVDIEVEFSKGLWVHSLCIIQVFMKRLTTSLPILRGKCCDWTRPSAVLYSCFILANLYNSLGVACWPLVPKFAGSNPAEAVGILGRKNPQHTFLRRGSKAVGPVS